MIVLFTVLLSSMFFTFEDVETSKIPDHPQKTLYNQTPEVSNTIKDTLTLGAEEEPVKFSVITEQPKLKANVPYSSPSVATPTIATPSTSTRRNTGNRGKNSSKINNSRRRRDTDSGCCGCCRRADFDIDNAGNGNGNGRRNSNCCDGCGSCSCSCSCSCPSTS